MRVQIEALFYGSTDYATRIEISQMLLIRVGCEVPSGNSGLVWPLFFSSSELRDLLDFITLTYEALLPKNISKAKTWLNGISFVLNTQNTKYIINENGEIILRIDENFNTDRASTLAGLQSQRYNGARAEFDSAYKALAAQNPNGKQAIRGVFEACEVVFKLMFPNSLRLAAPELGKHLTPFVANHYAADLPARQSADKLVQAFTDWVASAQFYRHGQGQEEPNQPPLEVAVALLSSGASYLRWLVHLDKTKLAAEAQGNS